MRKVDIPLAFIKGAAVGEIAFVWVNFTLKSFKMAWHIISTFPDEYTLNVISMAVCEDCGSRYIVDGNELGYEKILCESCREMNLKKYFL